MAMNPDSIDNSNKKGVQMMQLGDMTFKAEEVFER